MPTMGCLDTLKYILMQFLLSMLASIVAGALMFVLVAFGVPFLIHGLFM